MQHLFKKVFKMKLIKWSILLLIFSNIMCDTKPIKTIELTLKDSGFDITLLLQKKIHKKKINGKLIVVNVSEKPLLYSNKMLKLVYDKIDTIGIYSDYAVSVLADYSPFTLDSNYTTPIYCIPDNPVNDFQKFELIFDTNAVHRVN